MTRSTRMTSWGAGLLSLVMAGSMVPVAAAAPVVAAPGDPVSVISNDFEGADYAPWGPRGPVTLATTTSAAHTGTGSLSVTGRTGNWNGIAVDALAHLEPGQEITVSAWVRLAAGTVGASQTHFTLEHSIAGGATQYAWVGSAVNATADGWTEITGTYTLPEDLTSATLYLEAANIGAEVVQFLVDDIEITALEMGPDVEVVNSEDLEDGSYEPWTQNGNPTLSVVTVDGDQALLVANRANDYDGIKSPGGLLEPGVTYDLSMSVRLADGTVGTPGVRFVVEPAYSWVGNTTMNADGWTTVSGSYTVPADADTATQRIYIGTDALAAPYSYLVDDISITRPAGEEEPWTPTPDPTFVPGGAVNPTESPLAAARGEGNVAALTFDDGPNPGETERLLDILAEHDITATFCVIGQNITAPGGAELLNRIVDEGHTLCNHGTSYADMGGFTHEQVEADLKANLAIIREALDNPTKKVPYFRAPNGSWGVTGEVAAALGMQPLGLGNLIMDWDGNDQSVATLTANLRNAFVPGGVVLVHDGGGVRDNSITAVETVLPEKIAEGWTFTLPAGGIPGGEIVLTSDFEDGLDGWGPRGDADGDPTVEISTTEFHGGAQAALVTDRTTQGDGIGTDVTAVLTPGVTYDISAWVKMASGEAPDSIWMSMQRVNDGANAFDTLGQFDNISSSTWTQVSATVTMTESDSALLYFETSYNTGGAGDFLVDDVVIRSQNQPEIQNLTPLKDTVDFPVGVAIDSRETVGSAGELVLRHFDQLTGENHMKPEAWYDGDNAFRIHPEAEAIMDFAQENDLRVYGHVLVWHGQTPAWFFTDEAGTPLTTSEADQEVLRQRMRTHIFDIAEDLSTRYGKFGSDTNPLVAWDVVNEVVSDSGEYSDGLRRSEWYRILGEEFIDLAFRYADEAFNETYAVEGSDRPITLFINDYNTEQAGKQDRYRALVERLLARDVPIDGVGHQFHVNLSMPVENLEAAIVRFQDLPLTQVVTELDVTTGTPETEALLVEQGYYYRDAFNIFREHAEDLFSVTVWGLTDNRSWRDSSGAPLLFDDNLQAKPAFYGAIDGDLPPTLITADVFGGDVAADAAGLDSPEWARLPLHAVGEVADFQLRWNGTSLVAYVQVSDTTDGATDAIEIDVDGETYTVSRDGEGADAVVEETATGWTAVVEIPLTGAAVGDAVAFDLRVVDGTTTTGWNSEGATATLTLVEELSFTETVEATTAPTVDGAVDAGWAAANAVRTEKLVSGDPNGAEATVRTLWKGETIYVLAEIEDPTLDATGSDPWTQDSLEIFIDTGNLKNGPYIYETSQLRINYENEVSFGTGDEGYQEGRLTSATTVVPGGYVVEAAIELGSELSGPGTFHGLDFQVNDASAGARTSTKSWADPTGLGYQTTARWGVTQLVEAPSSVWFTDVPESNEFYEDILWLVEQGITTGYADGTFRPTAPVSRQAMAAFLYRMVTGEEDAPACTTAPFSDVPVADPFCGEITWLADQGITTGDADGRFRPTAPVSRQAMAAFLYRVVEGPGPPPACTTAPFSDVPVSHQFCGAIAWMDANDIANGYSNGTYRPTTPVSRQAMAAFLHRTSDVMSAE